jgi:hypothetical protein
MKDLSVVIVSFNTRKLLEKCLGSVFAEAKAFPVGKIEVLVVDNASEDGSPLMVKEDFPKVRLIVNNRNLGFAKGNNIGIKVAEGKYIMLLNSDTCLKRGALKELLDFAAEADPAVIGPRLINPDGSPQPSVFRLPSVKRAILEYWLGKKGYFSKYLPEGNEPLEVEAVLGGAMLIPRKIIQKIGLLDERYFMYFEDLDYFRRVRKAGFKVFYLPTAEIIHEHGASGRKLAAAEEQWRRLIPSSKIYYGLLKHYLITAIIWSGQKFGKLFFKGSS